MQWTTLSHCTSSNKLLDAAGVRNNGVQDDTLTGARYIAFYDPDGIAWELYAMPASPASTSTTEGVA